MSDTFVTVIKVLASLSALYMCLSPSTAMYRIHKSRSTGSASIAPLVALWGCNHIWVMYGYVTDDVFPLVVTYLVGDVTSVVFIAIYYRYTTDKALARRACLGMLLINVLVTIYAVMGKTGSLHQQQADVKLITGICAITSSIVLYASPFATIKHVVTTRSSESIPFAMVLVGILNNALWVVYGVLIHDALLVIPTAVNICIGSVQFVLYFVFHPTRQKPGAAVAHGALESSNGGAIEIVTDAPRLEQLEPQIVVVPTKPSNALTLSSIQLEAEESYVEVRTPGRYANLPSSGYTTES